MKQFCLLLVWMMSVSVLVAQEVNYVHTDAADYAPGDRIWLKVYVVNNSAGQETDSESLYAYVEMLAAGGAQVAKAKVVCRDGVYAGYLDIPSSIEKGRYWLRSYTARSLKNASHTECVIPIYIGMQAGLTERDSVSHQAENGNTGRPICPMTIVTDQAVYMPGAQVTLRLVLPELQDGEMADVSVSVTGPTGFRRHRPSTIVHFLPVIQDTLNSACESTQTLTGRVVTPIRRRPVSGATVSLISPQAGCFATTITDSEGRFLFSGLDFPEGTQYVLRAVTSDGKERVELTVDEPEWPEFVEPDIPDGEDGEFVDMMTDGLNPSNVDGVLLTNVEVMGVRRKTASRSDMYAQTADFSFGLQKIEEIGATCLHELIRHIPGVRIHQNRCYIRANTSIFGDNPAAIAIDGVIVADEYDLDNIQMQDVVRVDVFKTGTTVIWGSAGGSGVISITTKTGTYGESDGKPLNMKKVMPQGYQRQAEFSGIMGNKKTLYWNPNITTDTITLDAADMPGICHIVVEGVTTKGRLIHVEKELIVQ